MRKLNEKYHGMGCHRNSVSRPRLGRWIAIFATVLASGWVSNGFCATSSDPVLDLLLEKGMITDAEAAKVKSMLETKRTNEAPPFPESKWKIGNGIKNVELFGDVRLRYENRSVIDPAGGSIKLNRLRYALRFGVRGEVYDNFYYGFRLDTSANPRSAWVTFGTSSSGTPYQGPFGKSTAGINVGQIYLGWRPTDWFDITFGKMAQPLYTTAMVWDSDYNPEGLAEHFKFKVGEADLFANLGQFLYEDTNPTQNSPGYFGAGNLFPSQNGGSSTPAFLLAWQAGVNYHFAKDVSFKVAPVFYTYTGHGINTAQSGSSISPGFSDTFVGQGANFGVGAVPAAGFSGFPSGFNNGFNANQTGINNLTILEIPWEANFKIAKFNARVFGDFAQNLQGAERARAAAAAANSPSGVVPPSGVVKIATAQTHEDKAYQIGFAIGNKDSLGLVTGSVAKKHAWEFRTYWQHVEQYALDPNLLDSDFFEGRGNLEGIYAAFAYGFTDNFIGTVRYGHAGRINSQLGTGGSNQDIPQMNPIQKYEILQLDLTFKL